MAKKTSPVPSLVVYPLAAVGVIAIYLHSSHPLASEGSRGPVNWGRKLGAS